MVTPFYVLPQEGQQEEQKYEIPDHVKDMNGTLYFSNVTAEDKGRYMCIATNSQGIINATIDIDVIGVCVCVCVCVCLSVCPGQCLMYQSTGDHCNCLILSPDRSLSHDFYSGHISASVFPSVSICCVWVTLGAVTNHSTDLLAETLTM